MVIIKQTCTGRSACDWFLEIAFVCDVGICVCVCACTCVSALEAILNLYNQLNKFVAFRNVMKLSMHGHGLLVTKNVLTETNLIGLC